MPTASRGGYTRGARPASPGDLTARIFRQNQKQAEAARKAKATDVDEIRRMALAEGIDAGWDRGYDAGYAAAVEDFKNAGIDTDAVLALDDEDA
jgi:flagellar biosynthesis/type III secretory pathway protein FliH